MKDLDFEELDRAVNSMIASRPTDNVGSTPSIAPAVPVTFSNAPSAPVIGRVDTVNQPPATDSAPISINKPVRPSNGRFMDMVRANPSSDSRASLDMPARGNSKPPIQTVVAPIPAPMPVPASTNIQPVSSVINNSTPAYTPQVTTMSTPQSKIVVDDHDADIDQISLDIENTLNQLNEPQESPFISGAKVDKRPLNALAETAPKPEPVVPVAPTPTPVQPTIIENKAVDPEPKATMYNYSTDSDSNKFAQLDTPLPAELQSDILSIESNENLQVGDIDDAPLTTVEPALTTPPIVKTETTADQTKNVSQNPTPSTSIQQQYVEKPNSGEKVNVSIYDTKSYHKAMDGNKNKKSLAFAIWLVLLSLASIGAGVAVYVFLLPNL